MSGEINVLSRTQIILVEETSGSVAIINGGPPGPAGPGGGGGSSHYEDLFGTGYDPTGPNVYQGPEPTSFPIGMDWTIGPWFQAGYQDLYSPDLGGGGGINIAWGSGDPDGPAPVDPINGTDPGISWTVFESYQDNYGYAFNYMEMFAKRHLNTADIWMEQDVFNASGVTTNEIGLQNNDGTNFSRIILSNTKTNTWILINAYATQTSALLTLSGGSETGITYPTGDVMLQVVPHPSGDAGVRMGYKRSEPAFTSYQSFVPWVDEVNNVIHFKTSYSDTITIKDFRLPLSGRARLWRSTNQTISSGTTWTPVIFDTEVIDTGSFINIGTNPTRITVPTTGDYLVGFGVAFSVISDGMRDARIRINGTGAVLCRMNEPAASATFETMLTASTIYHLTANDYLELEVRQDSGNNSLTLNSNTPGETPVMWLMGPL